MIDDKNLNTHHVLTISDLRILGLQGQATARLETGEIANLKPKYATIERQGIISGQVVPVAVIVYYPDLYPQIRTIQRDRVLIARKTKVNGDWVLQLTGSGYHRPIS